MIKDAKRIAITGGAGLIGSHLAEQLVATGAPVTVIDDFSRGQASNLSAVSSQIEIREGNLEEAEFTKSALADCDVVFHLASRAFGVAYSQGRHLEILHHNETITDNLLTACSANPPKAMLVTSSSCVYPDDGPDTIPELPVFTREPEQVNWGYGWAKRFLEQKAVLFAKEFATPMTIVRPFNIYGERYRWAGNFSQAIPMLVKRILDGESPVVVWGSGQQRRSYIHAADCARMMRNLVAAGHAGDPINLGTEKTITMNGLAALICKVADINVEISNEPMKPEGRFTKSADMSRFDEVLPGFALETSLEEGLTRMIDWYRQTNFETPTTGAV